MSFLKEFTLTRSKKELSPQLQSLSKPERAELSKSIYSILNESLLDLEGLLFTEHFTKKEQSVVFTFLSFLIHEGYSQVKQQQLALKAGVSVPLVIQVRDKLVDLGIIQDVPVRRQGRQRASLYVLVLHPNYLKVSQYVQERFAISLDIPATFSQYFSQLFSQSKPEIPCYEKTESDNFDSNSFTSPKEKEMYKDIYEPVSSAPSMEFVDQKSEVYVAAAGIPERLAQELSCGLNSTETLKVWKSLSRTLHKYNATYVHYEDLIIEAVRHTFVLYKAADNNVKNRFNFAGCICGKTKARIKQSLTDKYFENWTAWMEGNIEGSIAGLLTAYEQITADLMGVFRNPQTI